MQLSVSNIGWDAGCDEMVYQWMMRYGFWGLEIAPTRILSENPYDRLTEAKDWCDGINRQYGFCIPSMQSIWFGRTEKLFGSVAERTALLDYTRKAIDFAAIIGCKNLVFGCPKNRNREQDADSSVVIDFFRAIGDYAKERDTIIGLEANPPIYHTNFINTTIEALEFIKQVNSEGFLLNLDVGTMIQNGESVDILEEQIPYINHVHVSEPNLKPIVERKLHQQLAELFKQENYTKFVSIEMGKTENLDTLENTMKYVRSVFA